jgi:hypothetical protein
MTAALALLGLERGKLGKVVLGHNTKIKRYGKSRVQATEQCRTKRPDI